MVVISKLKSGMLVSWILLNCFYNINYIIHYTTSCKHSLELLRMGEIIARNMLS